MTGVDRRAFIAHGLAVILGAGIGHAQPAKPIPRIGYLLSVPLAEKPSLGRAAYVLTTAMTSSTVNPVPPSSLQLRTTVT